MSQLPEFSTYHGHFITPRLAVGRCPNPEEIDDIIAAGVRSIINVVAYCGPESMAYVSRLPENILWVHLAFWDGWLTRDKPGYRETLSGGYARYLVQRAAIAMRDQSPVLVHCMAGIGRSGNLTAILLAASEGITPDEAIERIQKKRPVAGFAHEGLWREAGGGDLVALAREVLAEPHTTPDMLRERVFRE